MAPVSSSPLEDAGPLGADSGSGASCLWWFGVGSLASEDKPWGQIAACDKGPIPLASVSLCLGAKAMWGPGWGQDCRTHSCGIRRSDRHLRPRESDTGTKAEDSYLGLQLLHGWALGPYRVRSVGEVGSQPEGALVWLAEETRSPVGSVPTTPGSRVALKLPIPRRASQAWPALSGRA